MRPRAEELNGVLAEGGEVHVSTAYHVTVYSRRHAGWFTEGRDGNLYVRAGRGKNCLSCRDRMIVGLRVGRNRAALRSKIGEPDVCGVCGEARLPMNYLTPEAARVAGASDICDPCLDKKLAASPELRAMEEL